MTKDKLLKTSRDLVDWLNGYGLTNKSRRGRVPTKLLEQLEKAISESELTPDDFPDINFRKDIANELSRDELIDRLCEMNERYTFMRKEWFEKTQLNTPEPKPQLTAEGLRKEFEILTGKGTEIPGFIDEPITFTQSYVRWLENKLCHANQFQKPVPGDELRKELIKFLKSFGYDHEATLQKVDNYLKQRKP